MKHDIWMPYWILVLLSLASLVCCLPRDNSHDQLNDQPSFRGKSYDQPSFVMDYQNDCFLKDGAPFRYISGGLHYFRIPSFYWKDRLQKAKALGLNTIQTYIPWNFHTSEPGLYKFNGEKDLLKFVDLVQQEGLLLILRPGPYIDAEWENGGLPWYLATEPNMKMRTSDATYMQYVQQWFDILFPRLKPKLYKNGGPIIAFQVENEYGNYYACDEEYLSLLKSIFVRHFGEDTVLFTTDGYTDNYMTCGTTPEIFATIDFGTEITPDKAFAQQRKYQAHGPLVNSEFYTGWLDYWGSTHQRRGADDIAKHLKDILALNASVNLYMFHGGTNFGFMNGVDINEKGIRLISPTSYDYDAPLSESGDTTWKYFKIREVLQLFSKDPLPPIPSNTTKLVRGAVQIPPFKTFVDFKGYLVYWGLHVIKSDSPKPMSELGLGYGFVCYTPQIPTNYQNKTVTLVFEEMSDEAIFIIDNVYKFSVDKPVHNHEVKIDLGVQLDILVVNQGRSAYAPKGSHYLQECKGICGDVRFKDSNETLKGWSQYNINDTTLWEQNHKKLETQNHNIGSIYLSKSSTKLTSPLSSKEEFKVQPIPFENSLNRVFTLEDSKPKEYQFVWESFFALQNVTDTYLRMNGFNKGQLYLNMYNLGRFWQQQGPQKTLFVPKSFLRVGLNVLLIIALDDHPTQQLNPPQCPEFEFVVQPDLG